MSMEMFDHAESLLNGIENELQQRIDVLLEVNENYRERDGEESDEDEDLPRFTEEAVKEEEQNDADCGKIEDIEINSHLDEILLKARSIREKAPPAVPKKLSKMSAELSVQTKSASKTNRSTAKSTKVPSSTSNIASLKINSDVAVQQVKVHDTASAKGHMHETKHNKDARDMYEIVDEISSMHLSHPLEFVLPSQSLHKDQSKLLTQLKGRPAYPPSALFNVFVRHFEYWFPMHDLVQGFSVEKCASYMQRTKEKFEKITHSKLQRLNATGDLNNLSEFEKLEIYVMWWNLQRCVIFYEHQMEANDGKLGEEDLYMHDENRCGELMGESQKEYSKSNTIDAVTAKKPHLSPIAVERDRVLLLSLVFNGTLSQLKRHYSKDSCKLHFDYLLDTIVFSTTNVIVKDKFIHFYDGMARSTNSFQHENLEGVQSYSWRIILVDSKAKSLFRQFLYEELERDGLLDWSISSPNVYGALSEMYAPRESDDANVSNSCENFPAAEELNTPRRRRNTCEYCLTRIRSIIRLRAAELNLKRRHFIFSTVILPFVIVLLLVFYCRDIRYPKLELRSSSIGGVGEILVGNGRKVSLNETFTSPPMQLFDFVGTPLSWLGYNVKSDDVFSILYEEYYAHSRNRWSSFVVDDSVEKWVQSSVHISDRSFKGDLNVEQTIDVLNAVKTSVCNMSSSAEFNDQSLLATGADIDPEILSLAEAAFSSRTVRGADESNVTEFCRFLTDMDVKLTYNETRAGDEKKVEASNTSALILQVSQSLEAKVTMLSNMTFFHDTPIFFKELLPYVYASREQSCSVANHSVRGNIDIKASHDYQNNPATNTGYRLFSHPFDDKFSKMKSINPAFVQRGYLGSVIVIMYVLLTSTSIFKFITQCRASGVKSQLHLSGVSPLEYWVANFIVEFSLLLLAFISILVAIYMDGPPISNFCLGATAEHSIIFVLSLCAYAASSVAANYLFACISVDQVTSQLFSLFSSLCGGLFLRLFIALQAHVEPYIIIHRLWLWISPSYAFSSNTYVLFVRYVRQFSSTTGDHEISLITPIVAMCIQVVAYLFLAVVFDTHYYRCTCWLHRLLHQSFVGSYVQDDSSKSSALYSMQSMMIRVTASGSVWDSSKNYVSHANVDEQVPLLSDHRESYHSMQSDNFAALKRLSSLTPNENCEEEINRELSPESFLVNIQNLNLSYQSGILSHSSPVVNHLNMHLQSGERVALMGINGGGKSTLYRSMTSTEMLPVQGTISIGMFDTVFQHWDLGRNNLVGYVPQEGGLVEYMTVDEAVKMFFELRLLTARELQMNIDERGLRDKMYKILPKRYFSYYIFSLSGGNKQKLAILLSNICNPALLLLDEPTSGIDPPAAQEIIRYLSGLPSHQTVLFASHRMEECLVICRRVLLLLGGKLLFDGNISDFSTISDLFYQVDIEIDIDLPRKSISGPWSTSIFLQQLLQRLQFCLSLSTETIDCCQLYERMICYSDTLIRITFEKQKCPVSVAWDVLTDHGEGCGRETNYEFASIIRSVSFRTMNMEEIFAVIIDGAKAVH